MNEIFQKCVDSLSQILPNKRNLSPTDWDAKGLHLIYETKANGLKEIEGRMLVLLERWLMRERSLQALVPRNLAVQSTAT